MTQSQKTNKLGKGTWITIPTMNEAGNIQSLMETIADAMDGLTYHICVVDDESKDETVDIINSYVKEHKSELANNIHVIQRKKNTMGSQRTGAALAGFREGLQHSDCSVFVDMDADFAHSPSELSVGMKAIQDGFDVAIASKYLPGSSCVNRPWTRNFLSSLYNWLWRRLIDDRIKDYSNGYRFYNRKTVEYICNQKLMYLGPVGLCEILVILLSHGKKVTEFPTIYTERIEGDSKLTFLDVIKAGMAMMNIAIRYRLRKK